MSTETLRPDAAGSEESINEVYGDGVGTHYTTVDEAIADEGTSYVSNYEVDSYQRDLYNLPASSGSGAINFIKIYFRCDRNDIGHAKPSLKSNSTVTDGTEVELTGSYVTYSQQWNTNPADSGAWEWADIDALQIGVSLKGTNGDVASCTQVYVEVDYSPVVTGTATLSGVGTLAGIGRGIFIGKSTLSGTGTLAAIGSFLRYGKATLAGVGTLAGIGRGIFIGKSTLSGIGTLAGIGRGIFIGKATLSGTGTLAIISQRICYGIATLIGVGTLIVRVILQPISNTGLRAMRQGESEREERKIFGQEQYTGGGWW